VSGFSRTVGSITLNPVLPLPDPESPAPTNSSRHQIVARLVAVLEVLICSDYPTQFALGATLFAMGYKPFGPAGQLQVAYVAWLSLLDAAVLVGLILLFLYSHGERPGEVLFGRRAPAGEIVYAVGLTGLALAIGIGAMLAIQYLAPALHSVQQNPLETLLHSRRNVWLFGFVVLVAGGIREEIQRAFLLHRFDVWLGGGTVGVVVTSVAFGSGHLLQGYDAAIVTGLLGALWGVVYLRRRSAMAPMVSHAAFDLLQILIVTMRG
jgi:membrane protease YdiL (CAAX protease family)